MTLSFLPLDLGRWDQAPGGDLFAVFVWADVRPLRSAAGLIDWRLNGALSRALIDGSFVGEDGQTWLQETKRLPWGAVLAVGLGQTRQFSEQTFAAGLDQVLATATARQAQRLAIALPGRDLGQISPERAVALLQAALQAHPQIEVTVVDALAALKLLGAHRRAVTPPPDPALAG